MLVKTEKSGFPYAMDVTYDPDRKALWALCDDSCGGVYNLLKVVDGDFTVTASYNRPADMPNLNNEGMAIAPALDLRRRDPGGRVDRRRRHRRVLAPHRVASLPGDEADEVAAGNPTLTVPGWPRVRGCRVTSVPRRRADRPGRPRHGGTVGRLRRQL